MNINIQWYCRWSRVSLGFAGSQEVDHTLVKFIIYPLTMFAQ